MRRIPETKSNMVSILSYDSSEKHMVMKNLIRFFNDVELKNSTKHKIEGKDNVFSLTVNKCDHPDVGSYRAHIDNGIDRTEQTAQLKVGGKLCI